MKETTNVPIGIGEVKKLDSFSTSINRAFNRNTHTGIINIHIPVKSDSCWYLSEKCDVERKSKRVFQSYLL